MSLLPPPEAIYPDSANRFATILVEMHLARLFGRRLPRNRCRTVDDLPLRTVPAGERNVLRGKAVLGCVRNSLALGSDQQTVCMHGASRDLARLSHRISAR
jgi:hypothetical protein